MHPLFCSILLSNHGMVRHMIEESAEFGINLNDMRNGTAPLHFAVKASCSYAVKLLLDNGADVLLKDLDGKTLLHLASDCKPDKSYDIHKLLLDNGAKCNDRDFQDATPLHLAAGNGTIEIITLLLNHGADINAVDVSGKSVLHYAASNPQVDIIAFILEKDFDINSSTNENVSALHVAAYYGNSEVCEFLLKHGAIFNKKSKKGGHTPLTTAVSSVFQDEWTVQILLDYGADVADEAFGNSVLKMAAHDYKSEIVRDLLMRHVAKMRSLNLIISEDDQQLIENKDCYKIYYLTCLEELECMKQTTFYNGMSIFSILAKSKRVISGYARNEELVQALEVEEYKNRFPVYFATLKKRFHDEVIRQRLRSTAANILHDLLKLNDPLHLVNRQILSFLADDDLKLLNESIM